MELEVKHYTLNFNFTAHTSRGSMTTRDVWFLQIKDGGISGTGEVAPIPRLSPEKVELVPEFLEEIEEKMSSIVPPASKQACLDIAYEMVGVDYPSVRFGLETALLDWLGGGNHRLYENTFAVGKSPISINGLVWMNEPQEMIRQVDEKLADGFTCIKLKVGALDFEEELGVLTHLRQQAPEVTIRLDANGAFATQDVLRKLNALAEFNVHSIEQPIAPTQDQAMKLVVEKSPIPIALDEELIGVYDRQEKIDLLDRLRPNYLVLKPTLLGGLAECSEWIELAREWSVGWWITSYLESNIGLSAIAQFTAEVDKEKLQPHGLGTGGLYSNNPHSPLEIRKGALWTRSEGHWDSPFK